MTNLRDWQKKASERRDARAEEYAVNRWRHKTAEAYVEEGISKEGFKVGALSRDREIDLLLQIIEKQSEALKSLYDYQKMNDYPEHEVRHELCCAIPQLYLDTEAEVQGLVEKLTGGK